MADLGSIFIFPVKSLDGVAVEQATLLESGALMGDREFALVDAAGKFVNGKRTAAVHHLRSRFDLAARNVSIGVDGQSGTDFHLDGDRAGLEHWLSDYFGFQVHLVQNQQVGFPDDLDSPGPTLISTSSLAAVASWFPDLSLESVRRRFRTNLEITGVEAFWEDRLFGAVDDPVRFDLGKTAFDGVNPCQRCIVPTRDALTGESYAQFQNTFIQRRQDTLPDWAERSRFNHFYRLAVNLRARVGQGGNVLRVGDPVVM